MQHKQKNIEALYKEKSNIIYRYLIKIGCNKEEAKDIVQDTFIKAIENIVHLSESNISAWLFKVAINKYYDLCRKESRHPVVDLDENSLNHLLEDDNETIIIKKENKTEIDGVVDKLKPIYKNLIVLKYKLELSYIQIGSILDMKEETIKTYLYRARNEFKIRWDKKNEKG
ncbi:MAG: RNA polymerase sigma factor [Peptostreptococcaceae bacterium]